MLEEDVDEEMFIFPDRNNNANQTADVAEDDPNNLASTSDMIERCNERQTKAYPKQVFRAPGEEETKVMESA